MNCILNVVSFNAVYSMHSKVVSLDFPRRFYYDLLCADSMSFHSEYFMKRGYVSFNECTRNTASSSTTLASSRTLLQLLLGGIVDVRIYVFMYMYTNT
jgi:hypothetical protein